MKVLTHFTLAFIVVTNFIGCTHTVETFKCKAKCETVTLECSANQKILDIDGN